MWHKPVLPWTEAGTARGGGLHRESQGGLRWHLSLEMQVVSPRMLACRKCLLVGRASFRWNRTISCVQPHKGLLGAVPLPLVSLVASDLNDRLGVAQKTAWP